MLSHSFHGMARITASSDVTSFGATSQADTDERGQAPANHFDVKSLMVTCAYPGRELFITHLGERQIANSLAES
jgi:hypothetical protein